jgi:hypothetical protein
MLHSASNLDDMYRWKALVNMNFRVPLNAGSSWVAAHLAAPQEGLNSVFSSQL